MENWNTIKPYNRRENRAMPL